MIKAATIGKAAGGRIDRHDDRRRAQFRAPFQGNPAAALALNRDGDLGPEMGQHFFGVIARGFGLDHGCLARRIEPGEKHRRLDLRRGDRRAVDDRRRLAGPPDDDRAAPPLGLRQNLDAHQRERIENAAHRPLAQRSIAVEASGDPMAADHAHHQPRAGAGVAEVKRRIERQNGADAQTLDAPAPFAEPLDARAEGAAGFAGVQNVVALQQTADFGCPTGQQAEDEGAMRNRLVAGRPDASFERARARRGQRVRQILRQRQIQPLSR